MSTLDCTMPMCSANVVKQLIGMSLFCLLKENNTNPQTVICTQCFLENLRTCFGLHEKESYHLRQALRFETCPLMADVFKGNCLFIKRNCACLISEEWQYYFYLFDLLIHLFQMHVFGGCYPAHQIVTSGVTANFKNKALIKYILPISLLSFIKFPIAKSHIIQCFILIKLCYKVFFSIIFLTKLFRVWQHLLSSSDHDVYQEFAILSSR